MAFLIKRQRICPAGQSGPVYYFMGQREPIPPPQSLLVPALTQTLQLQFQLIEEEQKISKYISLVQREISQHRHLLMEMVNFSSLRTRLQSTLKFANRTLGLRQLKQHITSKKVEFQQNFDFSARFNQIYRMMLRGDQLIITLNSQASLFQVSPDGKLLFVCFQNDFCCFQISTKRLLFKKVLFKVDGICWDDLGNMYVAQSHTISRFDASTAVALQLAQTRSCYSRIKGLNFKDNSIIYFDITEQKAFKMQIGKWAKIMIAGTKYNKFIQRGQSAAVLKDNSLFVADAEGGKLIQWKGVNILKYYFDGCSQGQVQLSSPSCIKSISSQTMAISDMGHGRILLLGCFSSPFEYSGHIQELSEISCSWMSVSGQWLFLMTNNCCIYRHKIKQKIDKIFG